MTGRALIINADDFGAQPEITRGIVEAMREGVVSSTSFIVNGPHSAAAAPLAKGLAVGLHLNFSRWSKLSAKGEWEEARIAELDAGGAERETHAQLLRFEKLLGRKPTHLDVHRHLHRHAAVLQGVAKAAASHRLPMRALDKAMRSTLLKARVSSNDYLLAEPGNWWTLERFEKALEALPKSGVIELMCHPGYTPHREVELATFTNPSARAWLERLEIVPVSWGAAFR